MEPGKVPIAEEDHMDVFAVAFLFFAAVLFGSLLVVGFVALFKVRHGRREHLEMKRHLQRIGV
jgi:hypothetical protein